MALNKREIECSDMEVGEDSPIYFLLLSLFWGNNHR